MDVKLKKGVVITLSYQGNILCKFDDTFSFTDTLHGSHNYDQNGIKQYYPKNNERFKLIGISEEYMDIK